MTIIIAEDHSDFRAVLAGILSLCGHDVHQAEHGEAALQLQLSVNADVLITDIVMPKKDGIETIVAFKQEFPEVKIIAMSAGGTVNGIHTLVAAKAAGADATFPKASEIGPLLRMVESLS